MNRFCSASGRTKEFNSANKTVWTFGLPEILDNGSPKMVLPLMSLQITQLSEAPVSPVSMVTLPTSQDCGEVKIRSNALQTIKELSNVRSDRCSWQSSLQLAQIPESRWETLKSSCHLPASGITRSGPLIIVLEPNFPNLLDLWFSSLAAQQITQEAFKYSGTQLHSRASKSETRDGTQASVFLKLSRWVHCAAKAENHCFRLLFLGDSGNSLLSHLESIWIYHMPEWFHLNRGWMHFGEITITYVILC